MFSFESSFQKEMHLCCHSVSVWICRFIKLGQGHNDPSRADLTVVAPGLDGKLDLVLRHSSWRWKCPRTAGHTEHSCLGLKGKALFLAVCCLGCGILPSGLKEYLLYLLPFGLNKMWITLLMLTRHCEFRRLHEFRRLPMLYQQNCNQCMLQFCSIWKGFFFPSSL